MVNSFATAEPRHLEAPSPWERPWSLPLLGMWFGVVMGLVEGVLWLIVLLCGALFAGWGRADIWMSPLGNAVFFGMLGALLGMVGMVLPRTWRSRGWFATAYFLIVSIFFFGIMLNLSESFIPGMTETVQGLIAIGLAVQAWHLVSHRREAFYRFIVRSLLPVILLALALGGGASGWQWWRERSSITHLPQTGAKAPNVLLVVWDTVRTENMSLYGYAGRTTPKLEKLARESTVFDRAFPTVPWTLGSHGSMFTGHYLHDLKLKRRHPLDRTYPTLAEALQRQGYATGGFAANTFNCRASSGLARGFLHYEDGQLSLGSILHASRAYFYLVSHDPFRTWLHSIDPSSRQTAEGINTRFLNWLPDVQERPFFVFLNYFDAHNPYLPPAPFDQTYGPHNAGEWATLSAYSYHSVHQRKGGKERVRLAKQAYDGCIAYLDQQTDRLLGELRQRKLLDNTLVIIVSDHGEQFGEHNIILHHTALYRSQMHVPLLLRFPGKVPAGKRMPQGISLRDIPATVFDLLGKADPRFPGQSLTRCWRT
ncbi:MAG TPA: sulfatase-like hydrolase/transferase, partial [Armatimonadota bacterium]